MKKSSIIFGIIALILSIIIGGWFLADRYFSGVSEKTIEIKNDDKNIGGSASDMQKETLDLSLENSASEKNTESSEGMIPDVQKEILKPSSEKSLENSASSEKSSAKIVDRLVDFGFQKSAGRLIDTIIIHSSYDAVGSDPFSISGIISEYKNYGVSPHYLIGRDGKIYRLVEDKNIAYHAGAAKVPDGRTNVNEFSIGIEMVNTKTDKFTNAQYDSLNNLIAQLKNKYKIKYILGHNQIAPSRKDDPWNFDWGKISR